MKTKKIGIVIGLLTIAGIFGSTFVQYVQASTGENASGFAWGGGTTVNGPGYEGIGWVSMNSNNCDNDNNGFADTGMCGGDNATTVAGAYGINIPITDGSLSGFAWSEYYGWLSFNATDLTGCPSGACVASRLGNTLNGWARFIAVRDAGVNSGGWSGWVSLSGTTQNNSPYGIAISNMSLLGSAWSDELGWIDFSGATFTLPNTLKACVNSCTTGSNVITDLAMSQNDTRSIVACYNTATACNAADNSGNVTLPSVWAESGTDIVSLSNQNIGGINSKKFQSGIVYGTETVTITYPPDPTQSVVLNVAVPCIETVTCDFEQKKVCSGNPVPVGTTVSGTCVTVDCSGLSGTRFCDFNWREVAP